MKDVMTHWAAWSGGRCPVLGVGTRWILRSFASQTVLWFCCSNRWIAPRIHNHKALLVPSEVVTCRDGLVCCGICFLKTPLTGHCDSVCRTGLCSVTGGSRAWAIFNDYIEEIRKFSENVTVLVILQSPACLRKAVVTPWNREAQPQILAVVNDSKVRFKSWLLKWIIRVNNPRARVQGSNLNSTILMWWRTASI